MSQRGVYLLADTGPSEGSWSAASHPAFSLSNNALDAALPHCGLPYGMVTELRGQNASGVGTSFALRACHAIQAAAVTADSSSVPWCAYLDPNETLFAPGVAQQGVNLQHLLVLHPPEEEALARTAVHIAQSGLVALIVLDIRTKPGSSAERLSKAFNGRLWVQTTRRLSLAIEGTNTCVLVLTQANRAQSLPLPVGMRLELAMQTPEQLLLQVTKERTGRLSPATVIPWNPRPAT